MVSNETAYGELVEVILMTGLDSRLVYRAGGAMPRMPVVGDLLRVPLLTRTELGVVAKIGTSQDVEPSKIKEVLELVREQPVLTPELLALAEWMFSWQLVGTASDCDLDDVSGVVGRITCIFQLREQAFDEGV